MDDERVVAREFGDEITAHLALVNLQATGFDCELVTGRGVNARMGGPLQLVVRADEAEEISEILREILADPPDEA